MKCEILGNVHIFSCAACDHQYIETVVDHNIESIGTPFMELGEYAKYSEDREFDTPIVHRRLKYACPKCGIIQIQVDKESCPNE